MASNPAQNRPHQPNVRIAGGSPSMLGLPPLHVNHSSQFLQNFHSVNKVCGLFNPKRLCWRRQQTSQAVLSRVVCFLMQTLVLHRIQTELHQYVPKHPSSDLPVILTWAGFDLMALGWKSLAHYQFLEPPNTPFCSVFNRMLNQHWKNQPKPKPS